MHREQGHEQIPVTTLEKPRKLIIFYGDSFRHSIEESGLELELELEGLTCRFDSCPLGLIFPLCIAQNAE